MTQSPPQLKKLTKMREHRVQKQSPKRSKKKCKQDILTDDSFQSDVSGDQSEENADERISEYSRVQPHVNAKHHYQPSDTQSLSSRCVVPSDTDVVAISEPDESVAEFKLRALSVATRRSETNADSSIVSGEGVSGASCAICNVNISTEHE